jgi:hypothetical protein
MLCAARLNGYHRKQRGLYQGVTNMCVAYGLVLQCAHVICLDYLGWVQGLAAPSVGLSTTTSAGA